MNAESSSAKVTYLPGSHERVTDRALAALAAEVPLFKEEPVGDINLPLKAGESITLDSSKNRALRLAERSNFLQMCRSVLWGDEDKSLINDFGELLRGAVEQFRPRNVFELHLLRGVVEAQWRLWRISKMQQAVFTSEAAKGKVGKYGLPAATEAAQQLDSKYNMAQLALDKAIQIYRRAVLTARDTRAY